jgi:hypothetical protein
MFAHSSKMIGFSLSKEPKDALASLIAEGAGWLAFVLVNLTRQKQLNS